MFIIFFFFKLCHLFLLNLFLRLVLNKNNSWDFFAIDSYHTKFTKFNFATSGQNCKNKLWENTFTRYSFAKISSLKVFASLFLRCLFPSQVLVIITLDISLFTNKGEWFPCSVFSFLDACPFKTLLQLFLNCSK